MQLSDFIRQFRNHPVLFVGTGMRDYRTGLYCVTKCCKARNYRLF